MQMSAVDLRITAHFTHLASHGAKKPVLGATVGGGSSNGGPKSNPMTKWKPRSVRRPQRGTWENVGMETQQREGRTGA
ncbi:unnamed protein product, partial [Staurois parvus]